MRKISTVLLLAALAGCSASATQTAMTTVTTDVAAAQAGLAQAVKFYGIAKGVAMVAEVADPSLAPVVSKITAFVDPKIAQAQTLLAQVAPVATTLVQLASDINSSSVAIQTQTAQVVTVVPNT